MSRVSGKNHNETLVTPFGLVSGYCYHMKKARRAFKRAAKAASDLCFALTYFLPMLLAVALIGVAR